MAKDKLKADIDQEKSNRLNHLVNLKRLLEGRIDVAREELYEVEKELAELKPGG